MSNGIPDTNFNEIDITNDYMFTTVMQDPRLCMELLEYLLPDSRIRQLKYIRFSEDGSEIVPDNTGTEIQKTMPGYFGFRGVRLDAYVDDGKTIYNIELQATADKALPRRSRLYQSHIDISQLRRGENYDQLRPCFVIFICKYDPFGKDLYRYSFRNTCDEQQGLVLNDGAYKLFFNTAGHIGDIPPKLKELLAYMNDTKAYPVEQSDNDLIHRIEQAVNAARSSQEWRDSYMIYQVKQREAELRGRQEGDLDRAKKTAFRLQKRGMSLTDIAEIVDANVATVQEWLANPQITPAK